MKNEEEILGADAAAVDGARSAEIVVHGKRLHVIGECSDCRFVRDRGSVGFMCADESEANPMHWQDTYADFGCTHFEAKG